MIESDIHVSQLRLQCNEINCNNSPIVTSFGIIIITGWDIFSCDMAVVVIIIIITVSRTVVIVAYYVMVITIFTVDIIIIVITTNTVAIMNITVMRRRGRRRRRRRGRRDFECPLYGRLHCLAVFEQFHQSHCDANIHHVRLKNGTYKIKKERRNEKWV